MKKNANPIRNSNTKLYLLKANLRNVLKKCKDIIKSINEYKQIITEAHNEPTNPSDWNMEAIEQLLTKAYAPYYDPALDDDYFNE